jgi:cytochrome P450
MTSASASNLSLNNLFRPELLANPYPFYHALRSSDPVHWDRSRNAWVLTRYADVISLPSDPRFSSALLANDTSWIAANQRAELGAAFLGMRRELIFLDPPNHTHLRSLIGRLLAAQVNDQLRRRVGQIADELLDTVADQGGMDVIQDFGCRLPFLVIADLMGIPLHDCDRLREWSDAHGLVMTLRSDQLPTAIKGFRRVREYFHNLVHERRARPGDDFVSALVAAERGNDAPSTEDVLANLAFVLGAAHVNTTNLIGNGLLALLRHPDQFQLLKERPALLASAVEELLRYDSPVQAVARLAHGDIDIGGKRIAKGQMVCFLLGAANRDPERFPVPDRLDLARTDNRHVAFAPGLHYCLGATLARLEGQAAFGALLRRFPRLRLADSPLKWHRNLVLRGLEALPVVF